MWTRAFGVVRRHPEMRGGQGRREREEEGRLGMEAIKG